jgi:hypothetical protein
MKKHIALVLALAIMFASPLFAAKSVTPKTNGWAGISMGYAWENYKLTPENTDGINYNDGLLSFSAEGANYFGKEKAFGVGYELGVKKLLNQSTGSGDSKSTTSSNGVDKYSAHFFMEATFNYQHFFKKGLGLEAGLGFFYEHYSWNYSSLSDTYNDFGLAMKATCVYNFSDQIGIRGGLDFNVPFAFSGTLSSSGYSADKKTSISGFNVMPFVSVVYNY